MSRFKKLSQTLWHCRYHIVWPPKYRYKVLKGEIARETEYCIRGFLLFTTLFYETSSNPAVFVAF
jgi:putative transposase